jgi:hypothetical protein
MKTSVYQQIWKRLQKDPRLKGLSNQRQYKDNLAEVRNVILMNWPGPGSPLYDEILKIHALKREIPVTDLSLSYPLLPSKVKHSYLCEMCPQDSRRYSNTIVGGIRLCRHCCPRDLCNSVCKRCKILYKIGHDHCAQCLKIVSPDDYTRFRETANARNRSRYITDPLYRAKCNARSRLSKVKKAYFDQYFVKSRRTMDMLGLKNGEDYGRFIQFICDSAGVTYDHLFKTHTDPHEIDHMISFDEGLDEHSELWTSGRVGIPFPVMERALDMVFHHTNLQILPAEKNLSKDGKSVRFLKWDQVNERWARIDNKPHYENWQKAQTQESIATLTERDTFSLDDFTVDGEESNEPTSTSNTSA